MLPIPDIVGRLKLAENQDIRARKDPETPFRVRPGCADPIGVTIADFVLGKGTDAQRKVTSS